MSRCSSVVVERRRRTLDGFIPVSARLARYRATVSGVPGSQHTCLSLAPALKVTEVAVGDAKCVRGVARLDVAAEHLGHCQRRMVSRASAESRTSAMALVEELMPEAEEGVLPSRKRRWRAKRRSSLTRILPSAAGCEERPGSARAGLWRADVQYPPVVGRQTDPSIAPGGARPGSCQHGLACSSWARSWPTSDSRPARPTPGGARHLRSATERWPIIRRCRRRSRRGPIPSPRGAASRPLPRHCRLRW